MSVCETAIAAAINRVARPIMETTAKVSGARVNRILDLAII